MDQSHHTTAFAGGNSQSWRISTIRYLGYAGLSGSNIYEFSMIYGGLVTTALLPPNLIFSSNVTAVGIASIVSSAIWAFYLCLSLIYLRLSWAMIVAIGVSLVLMATFFSFFGLTLSAHGDDAVRGIRERISAAHQDLASIDDGTTRTFTAQLDALEQSRQDACNGRDETGIAVCGSISTKYLHSATKLRNSYAGFLSTSILPADTPVSSLGEGIDRAEVAARSLKPKMAAFKRFGHEAGIVTAETQTAYSTVAENIAGLRSEMPNGSPSSRDIVVQLTFEDLSALFTLSAAPAVYLRAVVAALPALLSMFFALVLVAIDGTQSPERLKHEIRAAKAKAYLIEKLASAQSALSRALTKLMGARIQAEVADSVLNGANKSRNKRPNSTPEGE